MLKPSALLIMELELVPSSLTMSDVLVVSQDSLIVAIMQLALTTVCTLKMLLLDATKPVNLIIVIIKVHDSYCGFSCSGLQPGCSEACWRNCN